MDWNAHRRLRWVAHSKVLRGPLTHVLGRLEDRSTFRRDQEAQRLLGADQDAWQELSRRLVGNLAAKSRHEPGHLRLLVVDRPALGGTWFGDELTRSFSTEYFSVTRHKRLFESGHTDSVAASVGAKYSDTFVPYQVGPRLGEWRDRLQIDLLEYARSVHAKRSIDLALLYGSYLEFEPKTLNAIRDLGIPVALLWLDDVHTFNPKRRPYPNGQTPLIGSVDLHLTNSRRAVGWYLAKGAAATWFPEAVDPLVFRPGDGAREVDVAFVGSAYGPRRRTIEQLQRTGADVHCFGTSWPKGPVGEIAGVYAGAKVVLGFGFTGASSTQVCLKGRDFEAPACGAAYLTTYNSELESLFDLDSEIKCYPSLGEIPGMVSEMLSDPSGLRAMGDRARQRILKQHTWTRRVRDLTDWLGLVPDSRQEF